MDTSVTVDGLIDAAFRMHADGHGRVKVLVALPGSIEPKTAENLNQMLHFLNLSQVNTQ